MNLSIMLQIAFILFAISAHPLQIKTDPQKYAWGDTNKKFDYDIDNVKHILQWQLQTQ